MLGAHSAHERTSGPRGPGLREPEGEDEASRSRPPAAELHSTCTPSR